MVFALHVPVLVCRPCCRQHEYAQDRYPTAKRHVNRACVVPFDLHTFQQALAGCLLYFCDFGDVGKEKVAALVKRLGGQVPVIPIWCQHCRNVVAGPYAQATQHAHVC